MDLVRQLFDASSMMNDLFGILIVVFVSLLFLVLPLNVQSILTYPFSFRTFGIRKIKRWHSRTDTLANLMLWVSVLFCAAAAWIPYAPLIYIGWLTFSWLCCVSRAIRLSEVRNKPKKLTVIFLINLTYGISLLAAMGFFNHYQLWLRSFLFAQDIISGEAMHLMYFLRSVEPADWLMQTVLLVLSLCSLWGQFKYMRLENTFKAASIALYVVRQVFFCAFIAILGMAGSNLAEMIYSIPVEERMPKIEGDYPLRYEEAVRPKAEEAKPDETQTPTEEAQTSSQTESSAPADPNASQQEPDTLPVEEPVPLDDTAPEQTVPVDVQPEVPHPDAPLDAYTEPVEVY